MCVEGSGHGIFLDNDSAYTGSSDENLVTRKPEQQAVITSFIYLQLMRTISKLITLFL